MLWPRDECLMPFPAVTTFREALRIVTKLLTEITSADLSQLETRGRGTETGSIAFRPAGAGPCQEGRK